MDVKITQTGCKGSLKLANAGWCRVDLLIQYSTFLNSIKADKEADIMIHPRFAPVVFALFMAFFMSGIMSLVVTTINIGFADDLISRWLTSWPMTFAIAFPIIMMVSPVVKRIVGKLVMQEVVVRQQ